MSLVGWPSVWSVLGMDEPGDGVSKPQPHISAVAAGRKAALPPTKVARLLSVSAPFDRLNNSASARVICSMLRKGATIEAIESVYRDRGADFFRLALARTSDPELARDAVQEGFARAIRSRAGFRGSGSLEAWICRCVLNAARDSLSRAGEPEPGVVDTGSSEPPQRMPTFERRYDGCRSGSGMRSFFASISSSTTPRSRTRSGSKSEPCPPRCTPLERHLPRLSRR